MTQGLLKTPVCTDVHSPKHSASSIIKAVSTKPTSSINLHSTDSSNHTEASWGFQSGELRVMW